MVAFWCELHRKRDAEGDAAGAPPRRRRRGCTGLSQSQPGTTGASLRDDIDKLDSVGRGLVRWTDYVLARWGATAAHSDTIRRAEGASKWWKWPPPGKGAPIHRDRAAPRRSIRRRGALAPWVVSRVALRAAHCREYNIDK